MKPKYRYNHKKHKWDRLYRFNTNVRVVTGQQKPDGSLVTFDLPFDSPLVDVYRRNICSK